MTDFKDRISETAASIGERASDMAGDAQSCARDTWNSLQHQTDRAVREGSTYARQNPTYVALAAFGLGFLLSRLLQSR